MKRLKLPKGLEIVKKKMRNRQDSFWYEGVIARYQGYTLIACGDIDIRPNQEVSHSSKWEDIAKECGNDKGLYRLVGGGLGKPDGELVKKYYYVDNNWFEVLLPDGESVLGDVSYEYDDAIRKLIVYAKERI